MLCYAYDLVIVTILLYNNCGVEYLGFRGLGKSMGYPNSNRWHQRKGRSPQKGWTKHHFAIHREVCGALINEETLRKFMAMNSLWVSSLSSVVP